MLQHNAERMTADHPPSLMYQMLLSQTARPLKYQKQNTTSIIAIHPEKPF